MEILQPISISIMAKSKIHSSTQDFTEIVDIQDDIVFLKGGNACMIMEVSSVNFFLLSQDEQNARIYGYMSLLNSLSSSIQILIVSRRVDLVSYIKLIEDKIAGIQNPKVKEQLTLYRDFIKDLIKGEGLLDKKIYIVIPFSQLELGVASAAQAKTTDKKNLALNERVKSALISKRNNVTTQVERMGLSARPLSTNELIKLYYELFNQEFITLDFDSNDIKNVIL
ncbi:MAG: hypothetical protein A3C30_03830 [Candidatus Levybacteria bacterium RIFCSPHIGHO2_02_FULL_40_18]|nr:MAG: hypothetical protein A2869_00450 [Candidatus Levybacteria bacterium RIFCSPHIGHO2_01_FULL_40_58]OGH26215.1 MAG: hypothetical protein A3C30_03830 [Candidatus Levybacteria bacterium RIFCSPHIGHO2_02_FULL_40_18]OGH31467.1 MAG: hypothetical protein A3E43_02870 [Candidatus Levybacteria bacterium RIFCSPHIGHO2_12_FULL_40_31]OGH40107.1 MAG: hypothetical protein A2894_04190 [Candidatus Levybacteria bacterium RIFCSPLOWO2_01_FULL_40_64]OGH49059.1 MAG: hypothetical protein A3I54_00610 [Candidatus Lev